MTIAQSIDALATSVAQAARDNAPALVTAAQADAQVQVADLTARLQAANTTITSLQAQHTADQATIAAQAARIAELEGQPPTTKTLFGISVNDDTDVPRVEKWTSPDSVQAVRVFYSGGLPAKWDSKCQAAYAAGVRTFHISFKDPPTQAALAAWKASAPIDVRIIMTLHHEPENDNITRTAWVTSQTAASKVIRAAGFEFALVLMGFDLNPGSGRNIEDWWIDNVYDLTAVDSYNKDADVQLPKFVAFAHKHGVPWAITETGASTVFHGTPQSQAVRVQWAKDTRATILGFADADKPQYVLWWDVNNGGFDSTLNDSLADAFFGTVPA